MRLLPNTRYGTEIYPEGVARRLRAVNLSAWIVTALSVGFAVAQFLDPTPGVWKAAAVNALAALLYASVPLLHRFGPHAAALALMFVGYADLSALIWLLGTGTGMPMFYLVTAALTLLYFGVERIAPSVLFGVLAVLLVIALEVAVPYDTGLLPPSTLFANFVVSTVAACAAFLTIVTYALREAARAEAKLVHEYEESQNKTRQLEVANRYKSHFLASASHDLRQPLHALNLFVAQLRGEANPAERDRLATRIDAAVGSMNELFDALLDMTKLEAGVLKPNVTEFPMARLLDRVEATFADAARKKGLRLRVVASSAGVSSDAILLERILLNIVSNAVRYTERGGVVVGCRRRGTEMRIDVCDTGVGIPEDQRQRIFGEYYQLARAGPNRSGGLGLGLAIVERLSHLLGHPVEVDSRPDCGSRFSVTVPLAAEVRAAVEELTPAAHLADPAHGKRVMVIDDDALVLDGMRGVLQNWGYQVHTVASGAAALAGFVDGGANPDLIISDCRLTNGENGIEVIERLRQVAGFPIPAFVITGDTAPERLREASAAGLPLLHKPLSPMTLRTTLNRLLRAHEARSASGTTSAV